MIESIITMTNDLSDIHGAKDPDLGLKVHHIGIVVAQEERMIAFAQAMGLREIKREHLPKYHVTNIFFTPLGGGDGPLVQFVIPAKGTAASTKAFSTSAT